MRNGNQEIQTDNREITHAAWFSRGNLPNHPPGLSIAGEMIDRFEQDEI
jgi:NAD+ diphosphatase